MTKNQKNRTRIITLRLTPEEYVQLEELAGGVAIGPFVRSQVLHSELPKIRTRGRRPVKDHQALGQILGKLGSLGIANHLSELGKAVRTGSLEVSPDTENIILQACLDIGGIRKALISALGLKAENDYDTESQPARRSSTTRHPPPQN